MARDLMLHAGGKFVEREELMEVKTPEPMGIWRPIPHETLFDLIEKTVIDNGLKIAQTQMGLAKEGKRFFALLRMQEMVKADYALTIGIRNSHDKSFPAGLVVGSNVFVCDNLCFSGEIAIARKHTLHIMDDLPGLVVGAVGKISIAQKVQDIRIASYRQYYIDDYDAHDIVIRATDYGVIPNQAIPQVLSEWRNPTYADFKERTAWSLFNAFTQVAKRFPVADLARRTVKLHGMFDQFTKPEIDITPPVMQ